MRQIIFLLAVVFLISCNNGKTNKVEKEVEPVVEQAEISKDANKFRFTYDVEIEDSLINSENVELWIPIPQEDEFQKIDHVEIKTKAAYTIVEDEVYKNKFIYCQPKNAEESKISVNITTTRFERKGFAKAALPSTELYLGENAMVPITEEIKQQTEQLVEGSSTVKEKAKQIYDEVIKTVKYDKSGEGWGAGDVLFVCDEKRGNCTDFHSLFIAMCRSVGIPARFVIGFPLPENVSEKEVKGYHCWAEFYDKDEGWFPVDASEAFKHPEKKEYLFGNLDYSRIQFTQGRDIKLKDNTILNFFIYPYCRIDNNEVNVSKAFKYEKVE